MLPIRASRFWLVCLFSLFLPLFVCSCGGGEDVAGASSDDLELRTLHGEVVDEKGAPLSGIVCNITKDNVRIGLAKSDDSGAINTEVSVAQGTEFISVTCDDDNFNPAIAIASVSDAQNGADMFGVTVKMRKYLSPPSIAVDSSLDPTLPDLPPVNANGASRPLAAMIDERGRVVHFVENELLLNSNDQAAVDAFVKAWNGEVLATVDFSKTGLDLANLHLIRIDTALADSSKLIDDLKVLDDAIRGSHQVSSSQGLGLIAAGARAAASGLEVGMNWVGSGDAITAGSTTEAANGDNFFTSGGYSPNAFDWNYFDSGSIQDIGVAPAWRLLSNLGKLANRQRVAILDMGYVPTLNGDIATDFIAVSNIPYVAPIGTANLLNCGSPCPWHGTNVANVAMGLVDNGIGAAGTGGPVARPVLIFTSYDLFTGISALTAAYASGARIMNMSYQARVPAILSWSVLPFEMTTVALHVGGAIMTASAGNDDENIDAEDCGPFGLICWEEVWHTPCENGGVMCVGGIGINIKNKDGGSNYGFQQVDIFAPYNVLVGRDQSTRRNDERAHAISGTSFSAPFVAGVAALVKAANPSLDGPAVQRILERTAHRSPDPLVGRYVNALGAVREALGSAVNIINPIRGADFPRGTAVNFVAEAFSNEHSDPVFAWSSDRDGAIGSGRSISRIDLSLGRHRISVTATFSDGFMVSDSVEIDIINTPPHVFIDSPRLGLTQRFQFSEPIHLLGHSIDTSSPETGFRLRDDQVQWSVNGIYAGTGHSQTFAGGRLAVGGPYTVRFIGSDGVFRGEETRAIYIDPDPADLRPRVNITLPANNASFFTDQSDAQGNYIDVTVNWIADDPEDGSLGFDATQWTTRINGGVEEALTVIETRMTHPTLPITYSVFRMRLYAPQPFSNTHDIRLRVTDSSGNIGEANLRVVVSNLS